LELGNGAGGQTRSSADADNGLDAFSVQSRSTYILGPLRLFAKHVIGTTQYALPIAYVTFILAVCCRSDATGLYILRHYLTK